MVYASSATAKTEKISSKQAIFFRQNPENGSEPKLGCTASVHQKHLEADMPILTGSESPRINFHLRFEKSAPSARSASEKIIIRFFNTFHFVQNDSVYKNLVKINEQKNV
jgi:hypothetical protein